MGVALGAQHAADHHLRGREALLQHAHQRDGAALADVADRLAEVGLAGVVQHLAQPRRQLRRIPAGGTVGAGATVRHETDLGVVRRVVLEQRLELERGLVAVDQRGQAQRQLEGGVRAQHVAGALQLGETVHAGHRQRRPPGAVEQHLDRVGGHRQDRPAVGAASPGQALVDLFLQDRGGRLRLLEAHAGDVAMEGVGQQAAGLGILQPVQHLAQDAERGRHHTRRVAGVDAFGQHLDLEHAGDHAAQRGRHPEAVVVAGAGVQADHQRDIAQARPEQVDVGRQVVGAGLLAGLDQADAARARDALLVQRQQRGDGGVDRVAVVGAAAAVELAVLVLRRPRTEVGAPAVELGLLVQVAVKDHGVGALRLGRRQLEEDDRRAAFLADDLQLQAGDLLAFHPLGGVADDALDVAVGLPVGIEHRALGGDGDVVGQRGDDLLVPDLLGEGAQGADFIGLQRQRRVTCVHAGLLRGRWAAMAGSGVARGGRSGRKVTKPGPGGESGGSVDSRSVCPARRAAGRRPVRAQVR